MRFRTLLKLADAEHSDQATRGIEVIAMFRRANSIWFLVCILALRVAAQVEDEYRLQVETDLVVLHATVTDKNGKPVADLDQANFRVFENGAEQQLKVFKREDIPVAVGIVVDNSGSMRDKRNGVIAAALKFVRSSNPSDQVFIVNFNDDIYLDSDFTADISLLERGLEKIDARGGTALYEALERSLDQLKKGTLDKKVLLVVSDGEDNSSRTTLDQIIQKIQRSSVMIYSVGLLNDQSGRSKRRAKRALDAVSKASGGLAFYPNNPNEVLITSTRIAEEIRQQYVLAYTPTNSAKDGTFRKIEVRASAPKKGKLTVRTRSGYYSVPIQTADVRDSK